MTEPLPCPFCGKVPAINRAIRTVPHSFWLECTSVKCAMREVRTHRCGDEESAIQVWNDRA